ncbi:MCE family protein [Nocardioidaceae bacterium]|nr:MCE family protein [Nocardioidaceae bacterium]
MKLDKATLADLVKLLIFMIVTILATGLLAVTIGNISFRDTREFKAVFEDVTGVVSGDDVRIAGVRVGTVSGTEIIDRDKALVTFSVAKTAPMTDTTNVQIRYRTLVGQRYIALTKGSDAGQPLEAGSTVPMSRTSPALDLTVLFNGFKPLFAALNPDDVNELSMNVIQVLQGEGGTVESLLSNTAGITNELASRDQLIGDLIANLNETLRTVGDRDQQLDNLLTRLRELVTGLNSDKQAILGSLNSISDLTDETADLVTGIRQPLIADVKQLRGLAATLRRNSGEIDRTLQVMPIKLQKIGRTAIYGSFFNFYLCRFTGNVKLPGNNAVPIDYNINAERCDL